MKLCTRIRLNPSNERGEFELDRTRSKNNIAENSFALGHEMDNSINTYMTNREIRFNCIVNTILTYGRTIGFSQDKGKYCKKNVSYTYVITIFM